MSMSKEALKLSDLREGELFRLVRSGERYKLHKKQGRRYRVKIIKKIKDGLPYFDGSLNYKQSTLHDSCYVERL